MEWHDYAVFDPGIDRPSRELPRVEAQAAYEKLMSEKADRQQQLERTLNRNDVSLERSPQGVFRVERWIVEKVYEEAPSATKLDARWISLAVDVALWVGDTLIHRHPHLGWTMLKSPPSDVSYQQAVVAGFKNAYTGYVPDFIRVATSLVYSAFEAARVLSPPPPPHLAKMFKHAEGLA